MAQRMAGVFRKRTGEMPRSGDRFIRATAPAGKTFNDPIVDPELQAAFAVHNAQLDELPHISQAIKKNNELIDEFLAAQRTGKASKR